ncbi:GHKL domain-containing protein [Paenibacillus psychroresistens]|uniref:histidine kinase n=1 Tax=Paenibacillus psychroresistens TaxID=1778678 RepID=A0A6B8RKT0_9BACL|nr:two-component regulator propeller domain-containing protein [Paenibacillus psychroresistens]QGQ95968.1 GHKL domain-containing protein [Paenibacillus psychroresistens]
MSSSIHRIAFILFFSFVLVFLVGSAVSADSFEKQLNNQPMDFKSFSTDQGLSYPVVLVIAQDKAGYMWFGSDDGLNKFDGYTFTTYTNNPTNPNSISNNQIMGIEEDVDGSLWVATYRGGLNQLDPETGKFKHYTYNPNNPDDPKGLSQENINIMKQDKDGVLWIGTGKGLNKFDKASKTFTHFNFKNNETDNDKINLINALAIDDQGIIWVGTSAGLVRFDSKTSKFSSSQQIAVLASSIGDDMITSLSLDANQDLWIGTQSAGVTRFDHKNRLFSSFLSNPDMTESISDNKINTIYTDRQGRVWLGTDKSLEQWDSSLNGFKHTVNNLSNPQSLNGSVVYGIYQDQQLNIWVATEKGLNLYSPKKIITYHAEDAKMSKLQNNGVLSFAEGKNGLIWLGTNKGVQTFDRETGAFELYINKPQDPTSVSNGSILALFVDSSGTIWAGSKEGVLNRFNPETQTFTRFNDIGVGEIERRKFITIVVIAQKTENELWLGTYNGLFIFDIKKQEIHKFIASTVDNYDSTFDESRFTSVLADEKGITWFGTLDSGLYKLDSIHNRFDHFPIYPEFSNNLGSNSVSSLLKDKSGSIWVGTKGGLEKFNPIKDSFERFTQTEGLSNNLIWGIVEDNSDNLWFSNTKGLSKLNPKTMSFHNYEQADGLQSNTFVVRSFLKTNDGALFFGGYNGFNWIRPELLEDSHFTPSIVIHSFKVFDQPKLLDKPLSEMKTIQLSYKENFFSFEFAALDYRNTPRIQYAYKLDGFDKDWVYSGSRRYVSYMNLKGGHYVLHIKSTNSDGVWNSIEKTIELEVIPAWWQRWWAYLVYVGLGSSLFILFIRIRSSEQAKKLQEQELMVAARTSAIHSLMDNSDQGFLSFGVDLIIQKEYSLACVRFLSSHLEGRTIHTLLCPNQVSQQDRLEKLLRAFFEEPDLIKKSEYLEQLSCETRLNEFTVKLDFKPIINADNPEDIKCMLIISDLSSLRQLETQMEEADEIYTMEKLAVLGQLAAGIAHEIRNPLTVIDGFMQIMLKTELEQEKRKSYLNLMHPEVKRINDLVSEFLMLAKPQPIKYERGSLYAVLKTTVEFMSSEASLHNVEIIFDSLNKEVWIEMDIKQMKQVFMNIIKNALEASQAGSHIQIQVIENSQHVQIIIIDHGQGISTEQLRKIFDPFYSQKDTGTGLGLTTSLNIVRNHQGDIEAFSDIGVKTSVIITLPLMKQV